MKCPDCGTELEMDDYCVEENDSSWHCPNCLRAWLSSSELGEKP